MNILCIFYYEFKIHNQSFFYVIPRPAILSIESTGQNPGRIYSTECIKVSLKVTQSEMNNLCIFCSKVNHYSNLIPGPAILSKEHKTNSMLNISSVSKGLAEGCLLYLIHNFRTYFALKSKLSFNYSSILILGLPQGPIY
jgi:hypothetical protein